jgi:choline kinase
MSTAILILAAGQGPSDGISENYPLCLAEIEGVSLIERIIGNTRALPDAKYIFALLDKEVKRFHLDQAVSLLVSNSKIVCVPDSTKGSACTALLAASQINPDDSLLIISANELVECDLYEVVRDFEGSNLDAGTLIFHSIHPRYSYVRLNEDLMVTEAAQQNPISSHATTGIFWFKRASEFIDSAKAAIRKDSTTSGNFYLAPTFNELILKQRRIGVFKIENEKYHPLKNSRQVERFESGDYL